MIPEGLFEDAASRSRVSMATRWERVKAGWRSPLQAGIAVALAWALAKWLWGHDAPFFAPVAAIIAIGQNYYERGRRARELVFAVTLGVLIADLLAYELGTGIGQLALAVTIAVALGMFFGTSALFVNQVAISAALVFTITPPSGGVSLARTLDALTGGVVALVVAAVVLPTDPIRVLRGAARPVLDELTATLRDIAQALRQRSAEAAEAALVRARGIDEFGERFFAATDEGRSTARISPVRRHQRDTVEFYAEAAARIDLAVRNVRVLARGSMRALALDENVPPEVADALEDLGAAVEALAAALESGEGFDVVREPALRAAATATHVLEGTTNLSVSVIVGQIRSTATDLLTGIGLTYEEATGAVRAASA
ncbi:FUSC family protein [Solirubrobacter sp. CPCC 204708]|uniref:FUSC family protein n=1 Tax=Solirubrobacter deserti TaxID=2282478 RepID=A0ABT4RG92_9ACTN|nr:FUSC family protein [Solirubrobacter deserti]MBE2319707.1 FUSC family protein [Solirubrobacter deserti]MDA0137553.1 FUSC family protein [Solirubrobacter deserti]